MKTIAWLGTGGMAMHFLMAMPAAAQSELTLSGDPQALVISTATAGYPPNPAFDEGTAYSLVAEAAGLSIQAELDASLPPGVALLVQLEPPPGAAGYGAVELGTAPRVLVSNIPAGTYTGLGIRYQLTATVGAGVVPISTRAITFTVTPTP